MPPSGNGFCIIADQGSSNVLFFCCRSPVFENKMFILSLKFFLYQRPKMFVFSLSLSTLYIVFSYGKVMNSSSNRHFSLEKQFYELLKGF